MDEHTTPDESTRDENGREGGLGGDGTIPDDPGGVGVGAGEPTTFEPEEDPEAAGNRDGDVARDAARPGAEAQHQVGDLDLGLSDNEPLRTPDDGTRDAAVDPDGDAPESTE
ncbi:hypothetical protein GE115_09030 [Agromyces sp. CFH 90414]|uniref:Uncharacterized protein n=1 Tax=Agromyces agglutinans TaxID=2662258 RepID=A0A6I2FBB1_9MICO|nr:hypothetical protein [Agromyces agglutinans]MRG60010.1 hypothetical protein [Agromyces agglutinans]